MTLQPEERLVIDASVAVKWVVPEPDSTRAEVLLDHGLVAPDLLFVECASVLWKKVRRGEMTVEEAEIAAQTLEQAELAFMSARGYRDVDRGRIRPSRLRCGVPGRGRGVRSASRDGARKARS